MPIFAPDDSRTKTNNSSSSSSRMKKWKNALNFLALRKRFPSFGRRWCTPPSRILLGWWWPSSLREDHFSPCSVAERRSCWTNRSLSTWLHMTEPLFFGKIRHKAKKAFNRLFSFARSRSPLHLLNLPALTGANEKERLLFSFFLCL